MTKHKIALSGIDIAPGVQGTESYWYPDPIPGFNVLEWKQENQARILKETEGMTDEQVRERFRQAVERAEQRRVQLHGCAEVTS